MGIIELHDNVYDGFTRGELIGPLFGQSPGYVELLMKGNVLEMVWVSFEDKTG